MTVNVHNIISNGYGAAVVSIAGGGGTIIPASVTISGGTTVGNILTAVSVGVVPISWQWYHDGVLIGGATASTYTTITTGVITVVVNGTILSPGVNITAAVNSTFKSIGALGANIEWVNSTSGNRLFTNAFYNGARMQKTGQPFVNCNRDPVTGWPTEAFYIILSASPSNGTTSFDGAVPPGTYNWSYSYDNTIGTTTLTMPTSGSNTPVNVGVTGFSLGTPVVAGNTTTVPFSFTFATLGTLNLSFNGPVTYVDCPLDGLATCVGQPLCRNEALASYSQYGVIRTLDLLWTPNAPTIAGRTDILWGDRPTDYTGPQVAADNISWERACDVMLAIKNYPNSRVRKWMVNIPPYSDPASYAVPLATLMNNKNIPANFLMLEYGNEPFNFAAGAATVRWHGWENAGMNTAGGIANYDQTVNASAPSALYQSLGQPITGLSLDNAGNVTVSLSVPCTSVLDLDGNPMITVGAPLITSAVFNVNFNVGALIANTSRTANITAVTATTFTYNTGVAVTTPVSIGAGSGNACQIFFKTTSPLLVDNLSFNAANLQKKWFMNRLYDFRTNWLTVRPKVSYGDQWYINISPIGGALPPGGSKTRAFEFSYGDYLGGGSPGNLNTWIDAIAPATYALPAGTVAAEADLFDSSKTTSLYHILNDPTLGQSIDNQCRGLVYQCLVYGVQPITYEGGPALQSASSSNFAVASAKDAAMETYLTRHQQVVLNNGVSFYMHFNSSPRIFQNGSTGNSAWQSMQFFSDSINSGDATYSAKKAALEKFNDSLFYTNIHGNDLTTLNASQYQNATVLTGNDNFTIFNNATTGSYYWGTGGTALNRNMDWVYCNNTLTSRTITVYGTDSQNTAVQIWAFPPDLSGGTTGIQLGTVHLANNGNAGVVTSTALACADPISWTPTLKGPYVIRLLLAAGSGTQPGILKVTFT